MRTDKQHELAVAGRPPKKAALRSNGRVCASMDPNPAEAELCRAARALRVLLASNQAMMRAGDESCLYQDICTAIIDSGGYLLAWIGLAESDARKSVRKV